MASIREVTAEGMPRKESSIPAGTVVALKRARADDPLALEAIGREVATFRALCRAPGQPACPRLYDVVGDPPIGIIMEWCPTDMERWWVTTFSSQGAFVLLCEAMADTCRRVREYEAVAEAELGRRVIHADIKPRNVLRAADGRWLLTDFGAAKSRPADEAGWEATRMIIGTENYIAPEALFNARKPHPAAMDTWSIGCSFFALLRMCTFLRGGARMPANGTHSHHFRSQRVAMIGDLHARKPGAFADRELDITQFSSPTRIPDKDRACVADALKGVFGAPADRLEEKLVLEALNLLDRALAVDPARRYLDPLEMAGEFEALATRYRELALRVQASGPTGNRESVPAVAAPMQATPPHQREEVLVVEEGRPGPARVPAWIGAALLGLLGLQLIQVLIGVAILALLWRGGGGAEGVAVPDAVASQAVPAEAVPFEQPSPVAAPQADGVAAGTTDDEDAVVVVATGAGGPSPADVMADAPVNEPVASAPPLPRAERPAAARTPVAPPTPRPSTAGKPVDAGSEAWGLVIVAGSQAYIVGKDGRRPPGSVPPGEYELFAQTAAGAEISSVGKFSVLAGERVVYKCGFGSCRRTQ